MQWISKQARFWKMKDPDDIDVLFATQKPYLYLPDDSVRSSRQSVHSPEMDQQIRLYSRMLKQIKKEVSRLRYFITNCIYSSCTYIVSFNLNVLASCGKI